MTADAHLTVAYQTPDSPAVKYANPPEGQDWQSFILANCEDAWTDRSDITLVGHYDPITLVAYGYPAGQGFKTEFLDGFSSEKEVRQALRQYADHGRRLP